MSGNVEQPILLMTMMRLPVTIVDQLKAEETQLCIDQKDK